MHVFSDARLPICSCNGPHRCHLWSCTTHRASRPQTRQHYRKSETLTKVRREPNYKIGRLHSSQFWLRLSPYGGVSPMLTIAKGGCSRQESFTAPNEVANGRNLTLTVTNLPERSINFIWHLVSARIAVIKGHGLTSKPCESARAGIEHGQGLQPQMMATFAKTNHDWQFQ